MDDEQYVQPGMRLGLTPPSDERQANLLVADSFMGTQIPEHPMVDDNLSEITTWGLYQNSRFGVCGPASVANSYRVVSRYLQGGQFDFTDEEVFDLYRRSGNPGFDPKTGRDDKGVEMTVMLSELVRNGIGFGERNVKALAFAKIDPKNFEMMRAAVAIFGTLLWGAQLQVAQNEQFAGHQDWDYVKDGPVWGGHATMTGAYSDSLNDREDRMTTVTWATPVPCTNAFITRSLVECYLVVWPQHLGTRQFQDNVDLDALAEAYKALTGKEFPRTAPSVPVPTPGKTQARRATPEDEALYRSIKQFVGAANTWGQANGLVKGGKS